ncbi:MAG TPA: stage III sporulation protein AB [Clostridiales bacterium]|nr:stage III sporulation protein AB [Clostridiales bacterium]
MRSEDGFNRAAALLPQEIRAAAMALPGNVKARAEELRLRAGREVFVCLADGERALGCRKAEVRDLECVLETATRASAHTALSATAAGFVTVRGGCRVGLCGEAVVKGGTVAGIRRLSAVSLRIPREVKGCADAIFDRLTDGGFRDTILVSPPGAGKTTLLRELVRRISENGARVALIDERGEVAGVWEGVPELDVGRRTDVMTGAPKGEAAMMLIRAMTPEILAADEITSPEDVEAMAAAAGCGVRLLATAHAESAGDFASRPIYAGLMALGVFKRVVTIKKRGAVREYEVEEFVP